MITRGWRWLADVQSRVDENRDALRSDDTKYLLACRPDHRRRRSRHTDSMVTEPSQMASAKDTVRLTARGEGSSVMTTFSPRTVEPQRHATGKVTRAADQDHGGHQREPGSS